MVSLVSFRAFSTYAFAVFWSHKKTHDAGLHWKTLSLKVFCCSVLNAAGFSFRISCALFVCSLTLAAQRRWDSSHSWCSLKFNLVQKWSLSQKWSVWLTLMKVTTRCLKSVTVQTRTRKCLIGALNCILNSYLNSSRFLSHQLLTSLS